MSALRYHWSSVVFYLFVELWGQLVFSLMYWTFANSVCNLKEARSFYTILIIAGNIALIFSGKLIMLYVQKNAKSYVHVLKGLISCVVLACTLIIIIYHYCDALFGKKDARNIPRRVLYKDSFTKIIKSILSSLYLRKLIIIIVSCSFIMDTFEIVWKLNLKKNYPNAIDYQNFMGNIAYCTGIISLLTSFISLNKFFKKSNWTFLTRIPTLMIGILSVLFFLVTIFLNFMPHFIGFINQANILKFISIWGGIQYILNKSIKYAFFDKTREMAYIPLNEVSKVKDKAVIDTIGSRLGRALSSYLNFFIINQSYISGSSFFSWILFGVLSLLIILWYRAPSYMSNYEFNHDGLS